MASASDTATAVLQVPRIGLRGHQTIDLSRFPKLSKEQAGHIRHFHNLANQPLNEWRHMGSQEPLQEFLDAYRYQLATMAYATGLAHYHRLPALRGPLKDLMRNLIGKMLERGVWGYWFLASLGGNSLDPSRTEYRKPWADPVVRENIMYSGHLLLMISLYAMLFDDDEFEQPNSMAFKWDPLFIGFGPQTFNYSTKSLQQAILDEMERNGWMGVCCEPNAVFVVCNQFPMIAMRYNDSRWNTEIISEVLPKYTTAWRRKGGMCGNNGQYRDMWLVKQDMLLDAQEFAFSAWANAFMNTWNSKFVKDNYVHQAQGYIVSSKLDNHDEVILNPPIVAAEFRKIVQDTDKDLNAGEAQVQALKRAKEKLLSGELASKYPYTKPILGYAILATSELGKEADVQGLLRYVDKHLNPTWENGGLFYPRNDTSMDEELRWTHVSPFCGNAAIAYGRLNVPDGQKAMWEKPWTSDVLSIRPYIDNVDLSDDVDFLRAVWSQDDKALIVTLRTWRDDLTRKIAIRGNNLPQGPWQVYVNGIVVHRELLTAAGSIVWPVEIGMNETDVIFAMVESYQT
ncbi:hypothetical protein BX600DRAFT_376861 [Xylariales sp. PMI_506]|nr:hypothetical protein BX600DRAFT_376861 [Xylariales sp. PMI_506]